MSHINLDPGHANKKIRFENPGLFEEFYPEWICVFSMELFNPPLGSMTGNFRKLDVYTSDITTINVCQSFFKTSPWNSFELMQL